MKVAVEGLTKSYGAIRALDGVSFSLEPGQVLAVLGANGAGKTTLLRCLAGITVPGGGSIRYDDQEFQRGRLDLRRRFHFLPDLPALLPDTTAIRHLGICLRLYGADGPEAQERVVEILKQLDLLPCALTQVSVLSRGQAYKTALAGLLAVDPELWLVDEPFASGMDPQGISTFKQRARQAAARGRTIIYSTQILDIAEGFSDRVCILHEGALRAFEGVEWLKNQVGRSQGVLEEVLRRLREDKT